MRRPLPPFFLSLSSSSSPLLGGAGVGIGEGDAIPPPPLLGGDEPVPPPAGGGALDAGGAPLSPPPPPPLLAIALMATATPTPISTRVQDQPLSDTAVEADEVSVADVPNPGRSGMLLGRGLAGGGGASTDGAGRYGSPIARAYNTPSLA